MGFPSGLSSLELSPYFTIDEARSDGGFFWQTEDADPYWTGKGSTGKCNPARLADWEGFVADAVAKSTVLEFVDPIYSIPGAYAVSGLPGGWDGVAELVNLDDAWKPIIEGAPVGLILRRGDRVGVVQSNYKSYHMVSKPVVVSSAISQEIEIVPPLLTNIFAPAAQVVFLNPVIRLTIAPNSWSAPRRAREDTIGSFDVREATVQE